ncbi:hypothetical protein [Xenophilus sp. Marseille-Q4582]|uniref:hypothetical protein n=1 Tax=Xenophilus sp. Marseille-Q4582 TaxID=2866600 RepID=UPI001CE44C92|nr:hypothetical protein [Xenophilus sp. Marseille-Q4582]
MSRVTLTSVSGKFRSVIDTAPIASIVVDLNIDGTEFAKWVGSMACEYHAGEHYKAPATKAADRELASYIGALDKMEKILSGHSFGSEAEAGFIHLLLSNGAGLQEAVNSRKVLRGTIKQELAAALRVQELAGRQQSAGGRPAATRRNGILNEIVKVLRGAGASARDARGRAERILIACRIPVPTGERAVRRVEPKPGDKN